MPNQTEMLLTNNQIWSYKTKYLPKRVFTHIAAAIVSSPKLNNCTNLSGLDRVRAFCLF